MLNEPARFLWNHTLVVSDPAMAAKVLGPGAWMSHGLDKANVVLYRCGAAHRSQMCPQSADDVPLQHTLHVCASRHMAVRGKCSLALLCSRLDLLWDANSQHGSMFTLPTGPHHNLVRRAVAPAFSTDNLRCVRKMMMVRT